MNVALVSLGCPKNQVDAEVMAARLVQAGHRLVEEPDQARVVIVNTCGFLETAREESIETILGWANLEGPEGPRRLIVTGCMVVRHREELIRALPEVDAFLAPAELERIEEVLAGLPGPTGPGSPGAHLAEEPTPRVLSGLPGSAYLKIADGCDNRCSYCTIPAIRGPYRSRPPEVLEEETRRLVQGGVREICLVAQDTTRYGEDRSDSAGLPGLIRRLVALPELRWLRLMYAYPARVDPTLIRLLAEEPKLAPYLDLPIQHTHPRVLEAMGRPEDAGRIARLIRELRLARPEMAIRSTVIVGHPGEDRAAFRHLEESLTELRLDHLGVFRYSPEEGTPSAERTDRPGAATADRRWHRLMKLQSGISRARLEDRIGQAVEVLLEEPVPEGFDGRTAWQAPEVDGAAFILGRGSPGQIRAGTIIELDGDYDVVVRLDEPGG